jgi:hypothetical protein
MLSAAIAAGASACSDGNMMGTYGYDAGYLASKGIPTIELKSEDGTKPAGAPASVFSSDYKTTVKVKARNLGNAYNTVPDLRDPQLELGVVAEMDWFQVEPGGIKIPF